MRPISFLYRALLYGYPREFRLEYGAEMERLFRQQYEAAARTRQPWLVIEFLFRTCADWLRSTVRERLDSASPRGALIEWAMTILLYFFVSTTLVQAYVIPTGSMEGNLRVGDHMLVDKTAFGKQGAPGRFVMPYREVKRGDIVAFIYPEDTAQTYVKRVIGMPGDRLRMRNKQVIRNGHVLLEPYTQHIDSSIEPGRDDFPAGPGIWTTPKGLDMFAHNVVNGEVVVPPDTLFMMGDNRDNSLDSRYWGFVPRSYVVGKPLFVYWSYDAPTEDLMTWNVAHVVDVAEHFFTKTRWDRMFLVPRSQPAQEGNR